MTGFSDWRNSDRDAFGLPRVTTPVLIGQIQQIHDARRAMELVEHVEGGGTVAWQSGRASSYLDVTAEGDVAVLQSRPYWPYTSGNSQLVRMTGTPYAVPTAVRYEAVCGAVHSEGGVERMRPVRSAGLGIVDKVVTNANYTSLIGFRLNPSYARAFARIRSVTLAALTGTQDVAWRLIARGTVATPAAGSWVTQAGSVMQTNIVQSGAITGGYQIAAGIEANGVPVALSLDTSDVLASAYDGTPDEWVLCAAKNGSGSANILASVQWEEQ